MAVEVEGSYRAGGRARSWRGGGLGSGFQRAGS